jgi:polyketide synthase PksN
MPTIFFEHPSVGALAAHLTEKYPDKVASAGAVVADSPSENVLPSSVVDGPTKASIRDDAVAIVGMSGAMPQSEDLEAFWRNLVTGTEMIVEIPADRWRWQDYYGDSKSDPNKTHAKWGGFMKEVD